MAELGTRTVWKCVAVCGGDGSDWAGARGGVANVMGGTGADTVVGGDHGGGIRRYRTGREEGTWSNGAAKQRLV